MSSDVEAKAKVQERNEELERTQAAKLYRDRSPGNSDAPLDDLEFGGDVVYSCGREQYSISPGNMFEVGPISLVVHVREGETAAGAYARGAAIAQGIFEAEFELKRRAFFARLGEVSKKQGA